MKATATDRLLAKLEPAAGGCLVWNGKSKTRGGYGLLGLLGKRVLTHRLAWELTFGPIPDGMLVCHRCDNPPCCNPLHLFVGTHGDNARDRERKGRGTIHLVRRRGGGGGRGRARPTHCPQGHPYDEANTYVHPATGYRKCWACIAARRNVARARRRAAARTVLKP